MEVDGEARTADPSPVCGVLEGMADLLSAALRSRSSPGKSSLVEEVRVCLESLLCVCVYVCMCACMYVCIHICTYIYFCVCVRPLVCSVFCCCMRVSLHTHRPYRCPRCWWSCVLPIGNRDWSWRSPKSGLQHVAMRCHCSPFKTAGCSFLSLTITFHPVVVGAQCWSGCSLSPLACL